MGGAEVDPENTKNEGQTLPIFSRGKRVRKKKQLHPDELSDWDSCEEDSNARRSPRKDDPLYTYEAIKNQSSSESSESDSSVYSVEQWPIVPKQPAKLRRALPEHGFQGKSDAEKKLFACQFCDYKNWYQSTVTKHMNLNHKSRLTCNVCSFKAENFKAENLKLLKSHMRTHAGQEDIERQVSQTDKDKNEAIVEKDNDAGEDKREPPGQDGMLDSVNSEEQAEDEEEYEKRSSSNKRNKRKKDKKNKVTTLSKCDHCSYTSRQKGHVARHIRERHLYQRRPGQFRGHIACSECDYRTTRVHCMARHNLKHAGTKPYRCEICNYRTNQEINLKRHHRTHTGESPFACTICEYRCKQSYDLTKHMRIHTGEQPYACHLCDYRSAQSTTLTLHLKRAHRGNGKHKGLQYACELCHFTAKTVKTFHSHMLASHSIEIPKSSRKETKKNTSQSADTNLFSLHDLGNVDVKIEMEEVEMGDMGVVEIKQEEFELVEVKCEEQEDYKLLEL